MDAFLSLLGIIFLKSGFSSIYKFHKISFASIKLLTSIKVLTVLKKLFAFFSLYDSMLPFTSNKTFAKIGFYVYQQMQNFMLFHSISI